VRTASDLGLLEPFWVLDMGSIGVSDGVNPPPHTLALASFGNSDVQIGELFGVDRTAVFGQDLGWSMR